VVEIELLSEEYRGKRIFIPRIIHTPSEAQLPFRLERRQFPLRVCFAMSINKSQGQSVKYVGLNMKVSCDIFCDVQSVTDIMKVPVFTHGQFYVAVSRVKSVDNIKVIWDEKLGNGVCKNVVYSEVLLN